MRTPAARRVRVVLACLGVSMLAGSIWRDGRTSTSVSAQTACNQPGTVSNPTGSIVIENSICGTPDTIWDVPGSGDAGIQGFTTDISANKGDTIHFKVDVNPLGAFHLDIYRIGYYQGNGARKITTINVPQPVSLQPACLSDQTNPADPTTGSGLIDCGNWNESASWTVPVNSVSGVYFAKAIRDAAPAQASHIFFVVRDDASASNLLVQTSDATWQAYNSYGGNSLYVGGPATSPSRAYKVSYNRPINTRAASNARTFFFSAEYPMIRFLEANGYSVSYFSGVDTARNGALIKNHKVFASVGHDEYWSADQRANVEAARAAGVHLAFFSGNEVFWKTRWENSLGSAANPSGTPYRTLVSFKESHPGEKIDPTPAWTGSWRDPRFTPPSDGGRPENGLTGTIFTVNSTNDTSIIVPATDGRMRFWRNTDIASLPPGGSATLSAGTLGYEWDEDLDNGARPAGLFHLSSTTSNVPERIVDYGHNYAPGTATHHLTMYRQANASTGTSSIVFGAGTIQWSWGLDVDHDGVASTVDKRMQQATVNLFADMGVQPQSLITGLLAASASSDTIAPTSTVTLISSPVQVGTPVTISGTAADAGGGTTTSNPSGVVAGVEVSTDGGATWHPATGRESWTYTWIPTAQGAASIVSRAADDSGNIEGFVASHAVATTVAAPATPACPCTIFDLSEGPVSTVPNDPSAIEVGLRFRPDMNGYITGVRFFRLSANTGTHIAHLWSDAGALLATATFTAETASGWQQVSFATPVAITAGTTYVASYHTIAGNYAADQGYFAAKGEDRFPLHALQDRAAGRSGVFAYDSDPVPPGLLPGFPHNTFQSSNYWVDVVFETTVVVDNAGVTISNITATAAAADAADISWTTNVAATSVVQYGTSPTVPLPQSAQAAGSGVSHTVRLTGLSAGQTYYYRVSSVDALGNSTISATQTFVMPRLVVDTTVADFTAGAGTNTVIGNTGDGELLLASSTELSADFAGPALPPGWTVTQWDPGGSATLSAGQLIVDGALVATSASYTPGHSLEIVATFDVANFQHAGFGVDLNLVPRWAIFTTGNQGATVSKLFAATNYNGVQSSVEIPGSYLGQAHRYRIDWGVTRITFFIDGIQVAAQNLAIPDVMRPIAASDFVSGGGVIRLDSVRMTAYAPTATFTSRVLNTGGPTAWSNLIVNGQFPSGSSTSFETRSGAAATPDTSWSPWQAVTGGLIASPVRNFIQYRAQLGTSDGSLTPVITDVSVGVIGGTAVITTNTPPVAVNDAFSTIAGTAVTGNVLANDTDANGNPLTAILVTQPINGTVGLAATGSFTYMPNAGFTGTDTFTYQANDGIANSNVATVSLTVTPKPKTTPTITWSSPADITYGTALGATQLNATASVPGTFTYSPAAGTVLNAGAAQHLTATFTPTDTASFNTASAGVTINVLKTPLTVKANDATKTFGQPNPAFTAAYSGFVNGDGPASLTGTLTFTTAATATSPVGSYVITPAGLTSTNYSITFATGTLTIAQAASTITWANPADITYGTALSATRLNATANTAGGFVYTPAIGAVLNAGTAQTLHVAFTPTDTNFAASTKDVFINVLKAPLTVTANNATKVFGTANPAFSATYSGFVNGDVAATAVTGTLAFTTTATTTSPVGSYPITPSGVTAANYAITFVNGTLTITQAPSTITWANPLDITYGTALSATQLNATANTAGSFVYTPALGTVLAAGTAQTLHVAFTPTDTNFAASAKDVFINVLKAPLTVTANNATKVFGTANPAFSATYAGFVNGDTSTTAVTGTLTFTTTATATSPVGSYPITPSGVTAANYAIKFVNGTLSVTQAPSTITWANPLDITYGTALSATQLNATANTAGSFVYTPAIGAVLNAGTAQTLHVAFTPTDTNFAASTKDVFINVLKAPLTVTANNATKVFGTANPAFSATYSGFVNGDVAATAVTGTLTFTTTAAATSPVGSYPITPSGVTAANYAIKFVNGTLSVTQAPSTITWANPLDITYGTALSATQLNATANTAGSFVYTPALGTVLAAGMAQTLHVAFTPTDTNFAASAKDVFINVLKATPTITWSNPADIVHGTALSATQLNATASVAGAFAYTPAAGTVLAIGSAQTLSTTFTPTDTANYNGATKSVVINVLNAPPTANAQSVTTAEDTAVAITLTASDLESDPLTYTVVAAPAHGTLSGTGAAQSYTPAANYNGPDSFTFKANDGKADSNIATVRITVTPVNDPPVAVNDAKTTLEDTKLTFPASDLTANDTDVDGDTLTVTGIGAAAKGTVTLTAGSITYTPNANVNGADSFTYTISDGNGGTATGTVNVTITAVNDAPSFTKGADQSVIGSAAQTVTGWATSISAGPSDESGQTLNFIVSAASAALFAVQPAISPTGTLTYTPAAGANGTTTVTVQLHDNGGIVNNGVDTSAAQTFAITVTSVVSTTTTVSSSLNPSTYGQAVTLTASVTAANGSAVSGTVEFFDAATSLGTAPVSAGSATLTTSTINAGARSITAVFRAISTLASSTSAVLTQTVNQAAAGTLALAMTSATPQYSDVDTFTATYTPVAGAPIPKTVRFTIGTQVMGDVPLQLVGTTYQATWTGALVEPSPFGTPPTGQMKPGSHMIVAATSDANVVAASITKLMTIQKEDARVAYTGPATASLGGSATGTVVLTASVKDITAVTGDAAWDANAGDIRNAQVQFIDRSTNTIIGTANVTLAGTDPKLGVATLNWAVNLGTATSKTFTVGFLVTNYYNRNQIIDNATITVSK